MKRYTELQMPDPSPKLVDLADGLDSSWYQLNRVTFGAFFGVMANAGRNRQEIWGGLRTCWGLMVLADGGFCQMLREADVEASDVVTTACDAFSKEAHGMGDLLNPLGMAIDAAYMSKIPTMMIGHLDVLAQLRVTAAELVEGPCMEFADELLGLHAQKMEGLRLRLEAGVFRLNSRALRDAAGSMNAAVSVFMGVMNSTGKVKEALASVAHRFDLPLELI